MGTKTAEQKTYHLKVSSAFTFDGGIARPGDIIEVLEDEAKTYLRRGKAVLATEADMEGVEIGASGIRAETGGETGNAVAEDLSKLTKAQLIERATKLMIADAAKMSKADILAAVEMRQRLGNQPDGQQGDQQQDGE